MEQEAWDLGQEPDLVFLHHPEHSLREAGIGKPGYRKLGNAGRPPGQCRREAYMISTSSVSEAWALLVSKQAGQ